MAVTRNGALPGGGSDVLPLHAAERKAPMALPLIILTLLVLGGVSFASGYRRNWPLPASAGPVLKVSGLVAMAASLVTLAAWGVSAAYAHVSRRLSLWLEGVRPALVEMSVFVAAYLLATAQRRRCRPWEDTQGLGNSMAGPQPFDLNDGHGGRASEGGSGSDGRSGTASASWRWVAGVVFAPAPVTAGARTGGGGPGEDEASKRAPREKGKKIVPSSP